MRSFRAFAAALACAAVLGGCHAPAIKPAASADARVEAARSNDVAPPAASVEESKHTDDAGMVASTNPPPCLPADSSAKSVPKHKSRTVAHSAPAPAPESASAVLPASPSALGSEATVKPVAVSSASILGKQVSGSNGDDLGRVVDVLADARGHVQIAVIDTGGFLGLGNRRIAVDWALLEFHPEDPQGSVTLNVSKRRLQSAPEYRDSAHPFALMAPAPVSEGKK